MACEAKRGCGYRKVNGIYLVGGGIGVPCDRLPFPLTVCDCCGQGIKQARGWTWIDVNKFFGGIHNAEQDMWTPKTGMVLGCEERDTCPLCGRPQEMGRAGLLWIGESFYATPQDFIREGIELGFSRRIRTVPRGFQPGETYVLLAHPKAATVEEPLNELFPNETTTRQKPGIFYVWLPQRIEKILLESQRDSEEIEDLRKRGITPVFVPDSDLDHQGSVYDKEPENE
jgi:hypothetical protein